MSIHRDLPGYSAQVRAVVSKNVALVRRLRMYLQCRMLSGLTICYLDKK
jgi:hypothetical protein